MKHKILLLLFLFSLLPSWGWGQETEVTETIDFADPQYEGGYTITAGGTYTFIGKYNGTPTQDIGEDKKAVIHVKAGLDVTIILSEVTIDLSQSDGCPLSAKDASKVNLLLKGRNTLIIPGSDYPGIWTPEKVGCGIIINEDIDNHGSLDIINNNANYIIPGIGSFYNNTNGYIRIDGGALNIDGGIGGFPNSNGGEITITGGTVIATSKSGAGIGSGFNGSECKITITGGTVTATSGSGAGIGDGQDGVGSIITITGGTVTATSSSSAGIGSYYLSPSSNYFYATNSTAFINASSISDKIYKSDYNTKGLIFDGTKGVIYGDSYTLTADAIIESGQTLIITKDQTITIAEGVTLTIKPGATLTNNGTIKCDGKINGTIDGSEMVKYAVFYDPNYDNLPADHIEYVESGKSLSKYVVNRDYYTFAGWFTESEDGEQVKTITEATTVYAHWKPIQFSITNQIELEETYGKPFDFTFTDNNIEGNILDAGGIESISWNNPYDIPNYLNLTNVVLFGTPTSIDENGSTFSFKVTAKNGATADMEMKFKVNKADLTITHDNPITKVYDGNNTVTIPNALKLVGVYSDDDVHLDPYILKYDDANAGTKKKITLPKKYTLAGEKKDCYNLTDLAEDFALTGTITQAPLTITPKPNQKLFEGEIPAYEVLGEVNDEKPEFTGSLGVERGKVVINSLALTTEFAQNYTLSLTPDIPITIINKETVKSLVQLNGTTNANGAYIDEVTVTAPDGFLIALESSKLKSSLVYTNSFTWNQKGTYDLNYKLKRISDGEESKQFSMEITVVESHYIPDNGGNDNNDSSIKKHNVDIPEVEGISVDKGFGEHWIENWGSFKFTITIEKDYRMLSLPVVKVNDSEIAFSSRTDTTFTYIIEYIRTPKDIKITGIVKDPATANNAIKAPEESWKIMNGVAYITVAKPTVFAVIDMEGNTISTNKLAPGETPIYNLPRAKPIVFWFDKERAVKVIIK